MPNNPKRLPYKTRRRWALFLLLIGMPAYVVLVLNLMTSIARLPFWGEVVAYAVLGTVWIFPFKKIFLGVGQADPDVPNPPDTPHVQSTRLNK